MLSDYRNILGNSSLRAEVASAGGTAHEKPNELLHPELEHNIQRASSASQQGNSIGTGTGVV